MEMDAGNFFPPEYKQFPFREGDLLVCSGVGGSFAVKKILKVDRFDLKEGSSINIQGQVFTVTEDDYLLVISAAFGEDEFESMEDARAAAEAGTWTVMIGHLPSRAPRAAASQILVGNEPVSDAELAGYKLWKEAFEEGEAGIW